jgi:4-amino-4-deoxy-L-arabinose transferase-like glycosyltransferase
METIEAPSAVAPDPLTRDRPHDPPVEPAPAAPQPTPLPARPPTPARRRRPGWWLDALIFIALFLAAIPVRWEAARGDLWFDEADYALAAVRGFEANRWDDDPHPPAGAAAGQRGLIDLRHHHPPMVAYAIGLALRWGMQEQVLRAPSTLAGALTVALLYLCGISLFRGREREAPDRTYPLRGVALACAVMLLFSPPHVRASSHALPWSWITLWIVAALWPLLKYAETRREAWLAVTGVALGGMFVASEYFFPLLLAVVCAGGILIGLNLREGGRPGPAVLAVAWAGGLFALIGASLWPAGLLGGAWEMLRYYMEMADTTSFPVLIAGTAYERAPKWAYLYWYATLYPPLAALLALGALTLWAVALHRTVSGGMIAVLVFSAVVLVVAHRSHIIGPEYLGHAVPLLILIGGVFLLAVSRACPAAGLPVAAAACAVVAAWPSAPLSGMTERAQRSRWGPAARHLKQRWKPGDRILAGQYGAPARWYLIHAAGVPAREEDVVGLPPANARPQLLEEIETGRYRFIAVGNSLADWTHVDNRIRLILKRWPEMWRSAEAHTGPSRLVIYRRPTRLDPQPDPSYDDFDAWFEANL